MWGQSVCVRENKRDKEYFLFLFFCQVLIRQGYLLYLLLTQWKLVVAAPCKFWCYLFDYFVFNFEFVLFFPFVNEIFATHVLTKNFLVVNQYYNLQVPKDCLVFRKNYCLEPRSLLIEHVRCMFPVKYVRLETKSDFVINMSCPEVQSLIECKN